MPDACPNCGAERKYERLRCDGCRITELEKSMQSAAGQLLLRISDIDFMLEAGFAITPDEVTVEEVSALKIMREERVKWQVEDAKEKQRDAEMKAAQGRQLGRPL